MRTGAQAPSATGRLERVSRAQGVRRFATFFNMPPASNRRPAYPLPVLAGDGESCRPAPTGSTRGTELHFIGCIAIRLASAKPSSSGLPHSNWLTPRQIIAKHSVALDLYLEALPR